MTVAARSAFGFGVALPPPQVTRGVPVESWTVTEGEIDAWLKSARTGETFVYAHGPALVRGPAAVRVAALTERNEVIPHHRRASDGGFDFIIRRNRVRVEVRRAPVCTSDMLGVLVVIQEAADAGERCPSDAAIGEATGLSLGQVKYQLRKLEDAKFIATTVSAVPGDSRFRVVQVVATGAATRGPQ